MSSRSRSENSVLAVIIIVIIVIVVFYWVMKREEEWHRNRQRSMKQHGRKNHQGNRSSQNQVAPPNKPTPLPLTDPNNGIKLVQNSQRYPSASKLVKSGCSSNKPTPCHNTYCSKEVACFNRIFSSVFPQEIEYSVAYPGAINSAKVPNIQSYLNTAITVESSRTPNLLTRLNPNGNYSCWCFDINDTINPGPTYTAQVVSLLDPNIVAAINAIYHCDPSSPLYTTYLGGILYIFNEAQNFEALGYSYQDIQVAIWTLLFLLPL